MRRDRIYPVPIKPRSVIVTWDGWPDDVLPILRWWNGGGGGRPEGITTTHRSLSFWSPGSRGSMFEPSYDVYRCARCEAFCEGHDSVAHLGNSHQAKHPFCDECIIAIARDDIAATNQSESQ